MNPASLAGLIFGLTWFVFAVPTAVYLLRAYLRSRMNSFLWLFFALAGWPLLVHLFTLLAGAVGPSLGLPHDLHLGLYTLPGYLLLPVVEQLIGGALLLYSVVLLDRELTARLISPGVVPPLPVTGQTAL